MSNGESIYATDPVPVYPYEIEWGMFTHKPKKLFMHLFDWKQELDIQCLANKIKKAYVLSTGEEIKFIQPYRPSFVNHWVLFTLPDVKPDKIDTVICIETEEEEIMLDSLDDL